ncbi:MAG TPA: hypothetical protein VGH27_02135 [Streptosporangiaceae bacterium]|jgi:hypothetical protein
MAVTFGELMRLGEEHLDRADELWRHDTSPEVGIGVLRSIQPMGRTLARLAADITTHLPDREEPDVWVQAAKAARPRYARAAASLDRVFPLLSPLGTQVRADAIRHVWQAAADLAAARELLHAHRLDYGQAGSDWTGILDTPEITGALLLDMSRWARHLAGWLSQTSTLDPALYPHSPDLRELACQELWAAAATTEYTCSQSLVAETSTKVLHGLPPALLPSRSPPHHQEPIQDLCTQACVSARRVRQAAREAATQAHWSPHTTADSWQWHAEAGAILTHLSGLLLTNLGSHPHLPRWFPRSGLLLHTAINTLASARHAWKHAATAFDPVTTDTRGRTSPVIPDLGDLLIRMGRLTYDNPRWTPARNQQAGLRDPAALIRSPAQLQAIATVTHEISDALACLATTDRQAIHLAYRASRLHVPTRLLTEYHDIPHPFGPATPLQVEAVTGTYNAAVQASTTAVQAVEKLILSVDAPSAPLAMARHISRPTFVAPALVHVDNSRQPVSTEPAQEKPPERRPSGPIENELVKLGVSDSHTLLQAAALDHAGRELIASVNKKSAGTRQVAHGQRSTSQTRDQPAGPPQACPSARSKHLPRA